MAEQDTTPHENALPNYQRAVIPRDKLEKYTLNPEHISSVDGKSSGRDKARVWKSALGFDQSNWELLQERIMEALPQHQAILGSANEYGQKYSVTLAITGPNGNTKDVITGWIIEVGDDSPRLTTAYCQKERKG